MPETMSLNGLKVNLERLKKRIEKAALKVNRNPADIRLVAVTKNVDIESIKEILQLGVTDLGENRVQELVKKSSDITAPINPVRKTDNTGKTDNHTRYRNDTRLSNGVNWHMVGHLQTNKVRKGLRIFDYLHSLDTLHLAETLEKEASLLNKELKVFIQVNISGEETKSGIPPEEAKEFYDKIKKYPHLHIIGLMTMAPEVQDAELTRPIFRRLKELLNDLRTGLGEEEKTRFRHLSMGMSNDFEVAIEEGATFIRIGTVLFKINNSRC